MSRRSSIDEVAAGEDLVGLRLPVPERDVIVTSNLVAESSLRNRIKNAPAREVISFTFEELEDLHRRLAFDANQTSDKKREKTIRKVLRKIEEVLDEEDDFDEPEPLYEEWDDELPLPQSAHQLFRDVFGSTPSDAQSAPPCPLSFTASQRDTLRRMDTISLDIHKLLAGDSQEELQFNLSPRQFMVISMAIKEAIELSPDEKSATPFVDVAQRISECLFAAIKETAESDTEQEYHRSHASPTKQAFQLKITLDGSKPPIWRRVLVADCTLDVLHQTVQMAMGWTGSHMHQFEYGNDCFSDPSFELDGDDYDETRVFLSQLVADGCQKLRYWYDFGDDWFHTIKIEKVLERKPEDKFPVCVKGVGACPPEDCGGIWGYYDFLEAIRDPKHERHDEFVDWAGKDFDPNVFDIDDTNAALAEGIGKLEL